MNWIVPIITCLALTCPLQASEEPQEPAITEETSESALSSVTVTFDGGITLIVKDTQALYSIDSIEIVAGDMEEGLVLEDGQLIWITDSMNAGSSQKILMTGHILENTTVQDSSAANSAVKTWRAFWICALILSLGGFLYGIRLQFLKELYRRNA